MNTRVEFVPRRSLLKPIARVALAVACGSTLATPQTVWVSQAAPVVVQSAPVGSIVTVAPPPARAETATVSPGLDYFWIWGHWSWREGRHVWVTGHWEHNRAGYRWVPFAWVQVGNGWQALPGHWEAGATAAPVVIQEPTVVTVAPPPPQVEVISVSPGPDFFWIAGFWVWEGGRHVWHPGHWEHNRPGYHWTPNTWHRDGDHWRHEEGRWERR